MTPADGNLKGATKVLNFIGSVFVNCRWFCSLHFISAISTSLNYSGYLENKWSLEITRNILISQKINSFQTPEMLKNENSVLDLGQE